MQPKKDSKMNVSFHGNTTIPQKKNSAIGAAAKGALFTATVLGTSTAISWAKEPQTMKALVAKTGGKGKYVAQYAAWLALYATAGAALNTALNAISKIIKPNNPPKAN